MEYSEDFKNMVKAHQGKFIGYGNPNARVLIIVPKIDDERLANYNGKNAEQWLANIENPVQLFDMKYWGGQIKPSRAQRIAMYASETTDREMMVTISFEKASKIIQKRIKSCIDISVHRSWSNIGVSDDSYIKSYVDKIAGGEIIDFSQKKKMCNRIIRTINGNVADNPYRWVDTWMYAFRKLKGDPSFLLLDSKYRYHHICELLTVLFVAAPHEAVKEIAAYIIETNHEYWYILSHIFHYCNTYRVASIMRNVEKPYLSKNTYENLMEVFKGIKSEEKRTIVIGKLLWLKHIYRSIYGKKLGY